MGSDLVLVDGVVQDYALLLLSLCVRIEPMYVCEVFWVAVCVCARFGLWGGMAVPVKGCWFTLG